MQQGVFVKIKSMKTKNAIQAQKFIASFNAPEFDMVYDAATACIIINKITYVPLTQVNEFTIELETKQAKSPTESEEKATYVKKLAKQG